MKKNSFYIVILQNAAIPVTLLYQRMADITEASQEHKTPVHRLFLRAALALHLLQATLGDAQRPATLHRDAMVGPPYVLS